jgi:hypothetical protein
MKWTTGIGRVFAGAAAVTLLAIPGALQGQQLVSAAMEGVDLDKAEALEAQALSLLGDPGEWDEAASLLRQAAALRPVADGKAAENLVVAGRLAYFDGDPLAAIVDLEGAATRASISGQPNIAVDAFLDAAWVADKADMEDHRTRLMQAVERIAQQTVLDRGQQLAIDRRVNGQGRAVLTARDMGLGLYSTHR